MEELFLSSPKEEYKNSFEAYVLDYKMINDDHYFNKYKKALENFNEYLKELPKGEVITSTFWLIHKNEVVGVVRIRHEEVECAGHIGYDISPRYRGKGYGFNILKLALEESKKIGLKEVVLTCNVENIVSKKIIERCNGRFLETIYDKEDDEHLYKYII